MADGDMRDRWPPDHRATGHRATDQPTPPDAQPRAAVRPARDRMRADASAQRGGSVASPGASGAPRPVAPTRPLAPSASATPRRATYGPQGNGVYTDDGADQRRYGRAAERGGYDSSDEDDGDAPVVRAPARRSRAGWRRFTPILLGLVAGVALVAVALAALILFTPRATPPPAPSVTTQQLCADLAAQRYTDAYALLSPRLQAQGTQAQFVASQRELDALQGDVTACNSAIVNVAGSNANASLQVTRAHAKAASAAITLTAIGSTWRVDNYDTAVI